MSWNDPWPHGVNSTIPAYALAGYAPARTRAKVAVTALALSAVCAVLLGIANFTRFNLASDLLAGKPVSPADADFSDSFVRLTAVAVLGAYVLAAIAFLMWLHRVARNNQLWAMSTRYSPGLAVGCWFIPFANLVMPFMAIREAWRAAEPFPGPSTRESRAHIRVPFLVSAWWILWLLSRIVDYGAGFSSRTPGVSLASQLQQQSGVAMVAQVLEVIAALLAMLVVLRLTTRQERKVAAVQQAVQAAAGAPPPAAPAPHQQLAASQVAGTPPPEPHLPANPEVNDSKGG